MVAGASITMVELQEFPMDLAMEEASAGGMVVGMVEWVVAMEE